MAGKLVATEDLFVGIHRAHAEGDEVPEENVKANGWEGKVKSVSAKKAVEKQAEKQTPAGS